MDVSAASRLIEQFENGQLLAPSEAERLLVEIFKACGQPVFQKGFVQSDEGVDCFIQTEILGNRQIIGVEVKAGAKPTDAASVSRAFELKSNGPYDRVMIVSRKGFSAEAVRLADTVALGQVDLLGQKELNNWLSKQIEPEESDRTYAGIVRGAMRKLVRLIAEQPEILAQVEWRDLERVLREAFEEIGFDTRLTRPGKDGGFDLELVGVVKDKRQTYLIEVKHWMDTKPGVSDLKRFVSVTASMGAAGGLLLSTSGFTKAVYSGITEISCPLYVGEGDKIVALCRTYYRLRSQLWVEDVSLQDALFSGTRTIHFPKV